MEKTYKEFDRMTNSISQYVDLVVVETANPQGQFIFRYNKNPGMFGQCANCYKTRVLNVNCACKKVGYCDEDCRVNDEKYHL